MPSIKWDFGHGRTSNSLVESYFDIIKNKILCKKKCLTPSAFLRKNYAHTLARLKALQFGVTQLSRSRSRLKRYKDDLNAKEPWSKRAQSSPSTMKRRGRHFNKNFNFIGQKKTTASFLTIFFHNYLLNYLF
jgi:hypothetical protein